MPSTYSKKVKITLILLTLFVFAGAGLNVFASLQENNSKLPTDLEKQSKFTKWIEKWKERFPQIEADYFKRVDDGEIISSTNPRYTFSDYDETVVKAEVDKFKTDKTIVIAPNKVQYLAFRKNFNENNDPTTSYVFYYGERDNKLLTGPIYQCQKTKCWFDRPFFITSDLFYIAEIQEKVYEDDPEKCSRDGVCAYEMFLHEFNLKNNKRNTYVQTQLMTDYHEVEEALNDL